MKEELPDQNRRIKQLVAHFSDGNVSTFLLGLNGMSHQRFNRIFNIDPKNGKYPGVSAAIITAIRSGYPTVNYDWLLTGEGSMLIGEQPADNTKELTRAELLKIVDRLFSLDEIEERLSKVETRLDELFPDEKVPDVSGKKGKARPAS
ncbi:MAG: hypothetical protein H0X41_11450 [Chitinophagaceae bacterium]|nr:hypothetical protein [Chitinophagaceae bacterium]